MRSYWPSVVASSAMLLATDALSEERTHGTYLLSQCDVTVSEHFDFAYLHGSAELLLRFAMTYDARVGQQLNQRIFNTSIQRNVSHFTHDIILNENFDEMCNNLTDAQRKQLTVKYADDVQHYILTIDDIRKSFAIPSILKVF